MSLSGTSAWPWSNKSSSSFEMPRNRATCAWWTPHRMANSVSEAARRTCPSGWRLLQAHDAADQVDLEGSGAIEALNRDYQWRAHGQDDRRRKCDIRGSWRQAPGREVPSADAVSL